LSGKPCLSRTDREEASTERKLSWQSANEVIE
jgi:hypothetical protein